jgi:hypothetical protein
MALLYGLFVSTRTCPIGGKRESNSRKKVCRGAGAIPLRCKAPQACLYKLRLLGFIIRLVCLLAAFALACKAHMEVQALYD